MSKMTFALRGKRRIGSGERGADAAAPVAGQAAGKWSLAANAGRQYASVSGDWNQIHLWPWLARLLGMKAPIPLGSKVELRLVEPAGGYQAWTGGTLAVEGNFG